MTTATPPAVSTLTPAYTHLRGLHVRVYREADGHYDFTRGGASGVHRQLTIIGILDRENRRRELTPMPEGSRVFPPTPSAPPAVLIRRGRLTPTVAPVMFLDADYRVLTMNADALDPDEAEAAAPSHVLADGSMFGGNLAASSDSRLSEAAGMYLPAYDIHDRSEARQADYGEYSTWPRWGREDWRAMPETTWRAPSL